jgi:hypothetical protein
MESEEEVMISCAKTKYYAMVGVSMAAIIAGVSLFVVPKNEVAINPGMLEAVGVVLISSFAAICLYCLAKALDRSPGLTIGKKGIVDNTSGPISAGDIAWGQIKGIEVSTIHSQKFLTINVRDLDPFVGHSSFLKGVSALVGVKFENSSIYIASSALAANFDDVVRVANEYFKKYGTA